ncbi:hypothetical protein HRbin12_01628 [bacterium HR12]|nr:hypothetical protein HRbin12_01628 [bacterium HR12]
MSRWIPEEYRDAVGAWLRQLGAAERKALAVGIAIGLHLPPQQVALLADPRVSVELRFEGDLPRGAEMTD